MFVAIGAPQSFDGTMITGFITYTLRKGADDARSDNVYVQLSTTLLPGSSGGPVIDLDGNLIGMLRFTITPYGKGKEGNGFAIPVSDLYNFSNNYKQFKERKVITQRGIVEIPEVTMYLVKKLNLPSMKGTLVSYVEKDSPAEKAGIQRYDFIRKVNDRTINNYDDFYEAMNAFKNFNTININIYRNNKNFDIKLKNK